ncbi:helix-turn-helix domain-containing protein [Hymenobacter sp. BT770]|uniref:helix-turn-helix domain-containing protein n=1 Tax=Hymenobacter sp. BT770 TaxID=2886942 RepID=UPI0034A072A7
MKSFKICALPAKNEMKIYIKHMSSLRCKMIVQAALATLGLHCGNVGLGEVEVMEKMTADQHQCLRLALLKSGLELMDDQRTRLIETIKMVVVEMVQHAVDVPKARNSEYISEKLHYDYTYLANLFSEATGTTIEHYIIEHKIERAKELLLSGELNLTQIAYRLNYSSVAHLSNQFKKVTGLTPSFFKKLKPNRLIVPECVNGVTLFCNRVSTSEFKWVSFAS